MHVQTTRFGVIEIDEAKVITFIPGLLGFSSYTRYVLLQPDDDAVFFWLQSLDAPELAFVVTDPSIWSPKYQVPIKREQMKELGIDRLEEAQVLVIVNKRNDTLTANLQGPLIVNTLEMCGHQMVIADRSWSTQQEILRIEAPAQAVSA
ncbi:MAG: flagellar assembly protein FliW [Phycisphaerales bacterium]